MIENWAFKKLMTEFTSESDLEDKGERRDILWCENPVSMGNEIENQAEAYDSKEKNTSSVVAGGKRRERMEVTWG